MEQVGDKMIILFFFTKNNPDCRRCKVFFDKYTPLNPMAFFCTVDIDNIQGTSKYLANIGTLPRFDFYFRGAMQGSFTSNNENQFVMFLQKGHSIMMRNLKGGMNQQAQPNYYAQQQQPIHNPYNQPNIASLSTQLNNPELDMLLPTLQQMQYMFKIFQMMQDADLLVKPSEQKKPDDTIELANGDKLIPLTGGKYGLVKKN
jgi:hypothetical protein